MKKYILFLVGLLFLQVGMSQNYSPVQINPFFSQFKALRALNYGNVLMPDTVLVKGLNGWIAGYPINNFLRSNVMYSNPSWLATFDYSKLTGAPTLSAVAISGSYSDLINSPSLFSGSYTDLTNKPTIFPSNIANVSGLQSALDGKQLAGSYLTAEVDPVWTAASANYRTKTQNDLLYYPISGNPSNFLTSFTEVDPTVPSYVKSITSGQISTWNNPTYAALPDKPTIPTTTSQLTNNSGFISGITSGMVTTALGYTPYNGTTNPNGYISSTPVTSVNTKTGAVVLAKGDIGLGNVDNTSDLSKPVSTAVQTALNAKLNAANIPFSKVKYYSVTSDASSVWTLSLGSDFTSIVDVQVQAVSSANTVAGIRQVSLNSWTSTSTTLSGITYGSNTVPVVLVAAVQALSLIPSTTVRVVVYGN